MSVHFIRTEYLVRHVSTVYLLTALIVLVLRVSKYYRHMRELTLQSTTVLYIPPVSTLRVF
jgi:hypothetical protein